ncbi:ABC transporter substrate binding protein, partial [Lacticaseibacillus paracasei subsp. paracasei Lpp41]
MFKRLLTAFSVMLLAILAVACSTSANLAATKDSSCGYRRF